VTKWPGRRARRVAATLLVATGALVDAAALGVETAPNLAPACGELETVALPGGGWFCTHGADPAPPGVDHRVPRPLESSSGDATFFEAEAAAEVPCFGDGTAGKRVQALYVRPADRPDRSAEVIPNIHRWAAEANDVFVRSAGRLGEVRHIRFVTTPDCRVDVKVATVSERGDDSLEATSAELAAQGYDRPDRKYLVWMDSTVLCGIAGFFLDDRPGAENFNNGTAPNPTFARVDAGCWGLGSQGQSIEAHELVHSLGGVQPTAPNATPYGHCNDEFDRMCYDDGSPGYTATRVCDRAHLPLLDCRNDDYFHTTPPPSSYLATHWNTARSDFLASATPPPPGPEVVTRIAGPDRIATALAASRDAFPESHSANAAVLANARTFADALTGVPVAAKRGGPLLLNPATGLESRVAEELRRAVTPGGVVYLLGGTAALSEAVERAVLAEGFQAVRYGGVNRYATAQIIAEQGLGGPLVVLLATGHTFADALAAGAAAAELGGAVLLTDGDQLAPETLQYVGARPTARRYALGGPASRADPTAQSIAGRDRYETAIMAAKEFFTAPSVIGLASGATFPDALAGGANIASRGGPMLLATPTAPLPGVVSTYLRETSSIERTLIYGGAGAVGESVLQTVAHATAR